MWQTDIHTDKQIHRGAPLLKTSQGTTHLLWKCYGPRLIFLCSFFIHHDLDKELYKVLKVTKVCVQIDGNSDKPDRAEGDSEGARTGSPGPQKYRQVRKEVEKKLNNVPFSKEDGGHGIFCCHKHRNN